GREAGKEGEVPAAVADHPPDRALTPQGAGVGAGHADLEAGFVDEHEPRDELEGEGLLERVALLLDAQAVSLRGVERLFFRVTPIRRSARSTLERLAWNRARSPIPRSAG